MCVTIYECLRLDSPRWAAPGQKCHASQARDLLADGNYFGTLMVATGDADGMVSGATHTTAATIRPGLQVNWIHAKPSAWWAMPAMLLCVWQARAGCL